MQQECPCYSPTQDDFERLIGPYHTHFEQDLRDITLAPYIAKARELIGVPGKAGANLFRHQMFTLAVLMDYGVTDTILLKAAVIHDLFEAAEPSRRPWLEEQVRNIDGDGREVCELVSEVSIRVEGKIKEPKSRYLSRIMSQGSPRARILKLADRISNVIFLGFVHNKEFTRRYLAETRDEILPYAAQINTNMFMELSDLVEDREKKLRRIDSDSDLEPGGTWV
jgi:(p)ppGpp synthase/HD superfamily hydrolase